MPEANPLIEHLIDMLADWGAVEARPRFGGWALYHQSLVFAIVAQDTLYLKVDDVNRERFLAAGGYPFQYPGRGGDPVTMSYWTPPDSAVDDAEELSAWAQSGFEAARRARALRTAAGTRPTRRRAPGR